MRAPAKFLFDVDFAAPPKQADSPATVDLGAHEAALAEAEARGYEAGLVAAEVRERTAAERQSAAAFERIGAALTRLAGELPALARKMETESVDVAIAVARKLAPALIAREPLVEITELVAASLRELLSAPHVVIRVNETLAAAARDHFADIARHCGFEGRLVVLGEADIALGDCRVEWADGGLIRDHATIEGLIANAVDRFVAERDGGTTRKAQGAAHG